MTQKKEIEITGFGRLLKFWRAKRKLSQLDLAAMAETTPRHLSFIEIGRSRPGRKLILRLVRALDLPVKEVNNIMVAAGFPPEYAAHDFSDDQIKPFRMAMEAILDEHNPYPACAMDSVGNILMVNDGMRAFVPNIEHSTPEQSVEAMFVPDGAMRDLFENWAEMAWNWLDRQRAELAITDNPRLAELLAKAESYMVGEERPEPNTKSNIGVLSPRMKVGDQVISTFTTMTRIENVVDVALSEVRVELVFPLDEASRIFFETNFKKFKLPPLQGVDQPLND
ncbi:MAG: helix-turn-helix domain-containing protein [Alphaproteobacteria bacterium]|nr:helix-turn-helix domain-containing protein [Alphaproteobacteria bacterium]